MMKSFSLAGAALAMLAAALSPGAAGAQRYYGDPYGYAYRDGYNRAPAYDHRGDYYDRGGYSDARYYDRNGYDDRRYYDHDGRNYDGRGRPRTCSSGTTGAILGAITGGLLGRTIDTRGDRTLGTLIGGAAGGLAGHAIEKSNNPGYCR